MGRQNYPTYLVQVDQQHEGKARHSGPSERSRGDAGELGLGFGV